jgi:integrase
VNLNARTVAALQMPTGKTDHIEWDDALSGFGYRLRAGAAGKALLRSWIVQYRRAGGTRRITLGAAGVVSAEQARKEAKKLLGRAAIGQDPQADRRERRDKDRHTLRSVAAEYLQAKKSELRPRSYVESERYLLTGKYFKPLHTLAINAVSRADVSSRILAIAREAGNTTANRARSNLNALFSWSIRMGLTDSNPVVNSVQAKESEGRTRVLSDSELAAIWRACGDDGDYSRIVRLLILLACRRQEIGSMQWPELDPERGLWAIPPEVPRMDASTCCRCRWRLGRSSTACRISPIAIIYSAPALKASSNGRTAKRHWARRWAIPSRRLCCTTFAGRSRPRWRILEFSRT